MCSRLNTHLAFGKDFFVNSTILKKYFQQFFHFRFFFQIFLSLRIFLLCCKNPISTQMMYRYIGLSQIYFPKIQHLKELLLGRICNHLTSNEFFFRLQSAYRRHRSTETAISKVILEALLN